MLGRIPMLARIVEVESIPQRLARGDFVELTQQYSALLWALPAVLAWTAPSVRYILIERNDDPTGASSVSCFPHCAENAGMRHELPESADLPPSVQLLATVVIRRDNHPEPLARLFEVSTDGAAKSPAQGLTQ